MKMRHSKIRIFCGVTLLLYLAITHAEITSDEIAPVKALLKAGKNNEAIVELEKLSLSNSDPDIYWLIGSTAANGGDYIKAKQAWLAYRQAKPEDWRVRSKLIQTYQALGDKDNLNSERKELIALWRNTTNEELKSTSGFPREFFSIENKRVIAVEEFEPSGDSMIFYSFIIPTADGNEDFHLSVGSYQYTNQTLWEMGKLPRNQRLYHLDSYHGKTHQTFKFYDSLPDYESARSDAIDAITGKIQPASASSPGTIMLNNDALSNEPTP